MQDPQPFLELAVSKTQSQSARTLEIHLRKILVRPNQILLSMRGEYARRRHHPRGQGFHNRVSIIFSKELPFPVKPVKQTDQIQRMFHTLSYLVCQIYI